MQWLATAPASVERDLAVKDAFTAWVREDREGLVRWLTAMGPEGVEPWFQPAVIMSARVLASSEPAEATKWAAVVDDEQQRELAFVQVARRWRQQDPTAAEAWLQQSPLSEEARAKAREKPRGVKRRREQQAPPLDEAPGDAGGR
jgi:hypothetical protein